MNKKHYAFLALLASGFMIAACSGSGTGSTSSSDSASSSSSSSEESSSSSEEEEITLTVSASLPKEIALGETGVDLDDYVTVTGTDSYSVSVVSGSVAVDANHVLSASGYGDFVLRISAGDITHTVEGKVVSSYKVAFNETIAKTTDNWTANAIVGTTSSLYTVRTADYVSAGAYTDSNYTSYTYTGAVDAPDGNSYTFTYTTDLENTPTSTLGFYYGIGESVEESGYSPFALDYTLFEEVYDRNGEPMNRFVLSDQTTISDFLLYTVRYSWSTVMYYMGCEQFLITVDENGDLTFKGVDRNFYEMAFNIVLSDIGTSGVAALDTWLENPTYPGKLDISSPKSIIAKATEEKNYTLTVGGYWTDGSSLYDCPSDMYSNNYATLFSYLSTVYVDGESMLTDVEYAETDIPSSYVSVGIATDTVTYVTQVDEGISTTYGTVTRAESDTVAWGTATVSTASSSIYDGPYTTAAITETLLDGGNFRYTASTTTGSTAYLLDNLADDGALQQALYSLGGAAMSRIYSTMLRYPSLLDYLTDYLVVDADETTVTYQSQFAYSTSLYYVYVIQISNIGSTTIPHIPA